METINIHGKEYATVNSRVQEFLKIHPDWVIKTRVMKADSEECLMITEVYDENDRLRSTGHAYERRMDSNINKTSHIENCETSAVGRALGFLGFGIITAIASADEVLNAISQEKKSFRFMTTEKIAELGNLLNTSSVIDKESMRKTFPTLTKERYEKALTFLKDNQA